MNSSSLSEGRCCVSCGARQLRWHVENCLIAIGEGSCHRIVPLQRCLELAVGEIWNSCCQSEVRLVIVHECVEGVSGCVVIQSAMPLPHDPEPLLRLD
eukprot:1407835-Amphidinium_carterae.3